MKRMVGLLVIALIGFILSGCGPVKKYCFIQDNENHPVYQGATEVQAVTGSIMIKKWECVGRVTVDQCTQPLELLYLGRTHPGEYIRLASRVGSRTPILAEVTYPENSKFIHFQDVEIEVIESSDNWIRFKLKSILVKGCNRVNGQDVK